MGSDVWVEGTAEVVCERLTCVFLQSQILGDAL